MPGPVRSILIRSILLATIVAGCSGAPATPPTTDPSAGVVHEQTAWDAELGDLSADGTRSVASALRLFAMAFGALPGIDAPDPGGPIVSGSPAIRAIGKHLDELTQEQRAAVAAQLRVPDDAVRIDVPETGASGAAVIAVGGAPVVARAGLTPANRFGTALAPGRPVPAAAHPGPIAAADQAFVNQVAAVVTEGRAALARKWTDFPGGLPVFIGDSSGAALSWFEATGGTAAFQCRIVISESGVTAGIETLRFSLYHELFHCAQAWRAGLDIGGIPPWVWEGAARYFAQDTIGFDGDPAWIEYMTRPETPLFARTYDAIGFWGHLGYSLGADVYLSMEAALAAGSSEDRFAVVGAEDPAFVDTWASGLASMITPFSRAWRTDGPGLTPALSAPREALLLGPDSQLVIEQAAYSNRVYALDGKADVVRIEIEGHARLGDGEFETTELGSALFCITDRGCQPCPEDTPLPRISEVSLLAISGGTEGTTGTVSGEAVDKECPTPTPPPTPEPTPRPTPSDDDEFCRRYKALVAWTARYVGTDYELTQPWAGEIARQSEEMRPYAPDDLIDEVDTFIRVYGTYASLPEPMNVPFVGPDAASLAKAIQATHAYCDIPFE